MVASQSGVTSAQLSFDCEELWVSLEPTVRLARMHLSG